MTILGVVNNGLLKARFSNEYEDFSVFDAETQEIV